MVGRLVQQKRIGLCEHKRGEARARALSARQGAEPRIGRLVETHACQHRFQPRLQRPVRIGKLLGARLTPLRAGEKGEVIAQAEEVGQRRVRALFRVLAEKTDRWRSRDRTRNRRDLARDQTQQRRLAGPVPADKAGSHRAER